MSTLLKNIFIALYREAPSGARLARPWEYNAYKSLVIGPSAVARSKRTVDFKGTKRVHIKTQKSDFDRGLNFRLFGLGRFLWKNVCPITSQLVSLWHDEQSKQFKNYSEFVISA